MKTIQLRRYQLRPGAAEDFTSWWATNIVPAREESGFVVEFAFLDTENEEFTWAVSAIGDESQFETLEAAYNASPARKQAFLDVPDAVRGMTTALVSKIH